MIDTKLGSYEIIEEIGQGGMATVYRAYQRNMDRHVAIKVISVTLFGSEEHILRFQREARLIARLEHVHILPVYDFDGAFNPPYIVMRYLEGGTLRDIMKQGQLPIAEIGYLMRQVCSGIDYAHRQGIVHRDIKPSNIMIDREGNAYVTDFGIARMTDTADRRDGEPITATGATIGTPDYMAPEQGMGYDDVDQRADVYSLGVMLFEMLTGQKPYTSKTPMEVIIKHLQEPIPNIHTFRSDLPPALEGVIYRALAKERDERYATVAEFAAALTETLGSPTAQPTHLRKSAEESQLILLQKREGKSTDATGSGSQNTPSEQNKTVTALYAHAADYANLVEEMEGTQAARQAVKVLMDSFEQISTQQHGKIFERGEHHLLALWGSDLAGEDDTERALHAALLMAARGRELCRAILAEDEPLPFGLGIHTGLALLTPADQTGTLTASGATINLTARIAEHAEGIILASQDTYRIVRGVFDVAAHDPVKIRGRKDSLPVYEIQAAKARKFRLSVRGVEGVETAMIGRETELKMLQNAYLNAYEEQETQVVTIISEAGIGKSRLLYEFANWGELREEVYRIFRGRATPAMTQRPYAFLRDIFSFRFEILDSDTPAVVREKMEAGIAELVAAENHEMAHTISYLLGFEVADSPFIQGLLGDPQQLTTRARQMFIRFFTKLTAKQLVVMELEDTHWADEASLDLLHDLVNQQPDLSLLIVCIARPLLLERRPTWGSGQSFHRRITLDPLDKRDSRTLIQSILQKVAEVPKSLRDVIVDRAEGNPYYMEEVIKMLIEDRVIVKESEETWTIEASRLGNLRVPPTLIGLLQARLDTLLYPEKVTLQRAAVFGRVFYDSAISQIDGVDEVKVAANLPAILATLTERDFILKRETSAFAGSGEYIFAQSMLRDAIYDNLLKRQLKNYHTSIADWLISVAGERVEEYYPLIAEHYERGGDPLQAAAYLRQSGDKALRLSALGEAQAAFSQALALLPENSLEQAQLQTQLADSLIQMGNLKEAESLLNSALHAAHTLSDTSTQAHALYHLSQIATHRGHWEAAIQYLEEAQKLAGEDKVALVRVLYGLTDTYFRTGRVQARETGLAALALAREIGDRTFELTALNRLGTIESLFTKDFAKSQVFLQEGLQLARTYGNRRTESACLINLGEVARYSGDMGAAIAYAEAAIVIQREIGEKRGILVAASNLADVYLKLSKLEEATPFIREALLISRQMDSITWIVSSVQIIATFRLMQGDIPAGLALLGLVRQHPAAASDTLDDILPFLEDLRKTLSEAEIDAGMAAGKDLDLDTMIDQFLQETADRS